ncbi:conjugal transfer protein TrbD [Shewanella sp.]|uniref:conjugal transfer protein TrbD n=1 Tax=Shewanella sp. TaxID=50422 RepID=UPI003D125808
MGDELLNRAAIFKFNRGNLVLGGERNLVYPLCLIVIFFVVTLQSAVTLIIGLLLWVTLMPLLRMMGNADPDMSKVFRRFSQYQPYYPAHSPKDYSRRA